MRVPRVRLTVEGTILVVAMVLLAAFDRAFYSAYMSNWVGRPKRGLAAWIARPGSGAYQRGEAIFEVAVHSVASLGAILLTLWVARRISRGRAGCLIYAAVGLILLLVLIVILDMPRMLNVIRGNGPPNG